MIKVKAIKNEGPLDCGWGNGYVVLPEGHPLFGKSDTWEDCLSGFDVHGGITYAGPDNDGKGWMLGFDTRHSMDSLQRWPDEASILAEAERLKKQIEDYYPADKMYLDGKEMYIDGIRYRLTLL